MQSEGVRAHIAGPLYELPPGLNLNANNGQVTGTPTLASSGFQVYVQVNDIENSDLVGYTNYSLAMAACTPGFVTPLTLPGDDVQVAYPHFLFQAQGCQPPYTFVYSGSQFQIGGPNAFPTGLSLNSTTGELSGTPGPGTVGNYSIPITVTEYGGGTNEQTFSLTINPPPTLTNSSPLPNGVVGAVYGPVTLTPSGGTPPYSGGFTESGLPPGLTLTKYTGVLTGTPTKAGTYTPTIEITDSVGGTSNQMFQITVTTATAQLQVSPASLTFNANQSGDMPASQALSVVPASGSLPPFNFTVQTDGGQAGTPVPFVLTTQPGTGGVAPAQIVVSVNQGSMAGGNYSGRIRVIDSNGLENDVTVNLIVTATPQQLTVVPNILHFAALEQSPSTQTATLAVRSSGGVGPLGFSTTVLGASPWITGVTPGSGQTVPNSPVLIQVSVSSNGLQIGSYHDVIEVSSAAGNIDVPVVLFVGQGGAIMAVNLTGIRLYARQNGGYSNNLNINVLNIGAPDSTVNWTASVVNPSSWLALGPPTSGTATASAPGPLGISLTSTATQMSPGGYYALIKITDPNSLNSPQYVLVVLDLESSSTASLPDQIPAGVFFVATAGGAQTSPVELDVNTSSSTPVPFYAAATTTDGGNWLIVNPTSGSSTGANSGTVNISVNPASLTQGVYTGDVNISMSGALRTTNITVVVVPAGDTANATSARAVRAAAGCTASKVVITETGLVNNFAVPAGFPATLIAQLNDDCGGTLTGGSVVASFSNGDAPLTLVGNGQDGTYSATWQPGTVTSQMVVNLNASSGALQPAKVQLNGGVAQNQTTPPVLTPSGTLHNLNPVVGAPLAPGTIVQVFGSGLGPPMGVSPGVIPLVDTFDNTYVLIGPYQAPLYFLSNHQLDVQLPVELTATQQYPIVVSVNNAITLPDTLNVVPATPGVAAFASGGIVAQHNSDFSLVTAANPAKAGEVIIMYLAGLGPTNPPVASGQPAPSNPPASVTLPVTVTVDNQNAKIFFAGLTPGAAGLYQIDFEVPANASTGNVNVVVMQNGLAANTTTLPVSQ
jgi:uncharacterized protein (TIGR03437 family)